MSTPSEVLAAVESLDVDELAALPLDDALRAWQVLDNVHRCLDVVRERLEHLIAEQMPAASPVAVPGAAVFQRHVRKDRHAWDKEMLYRAVMDARLADKKTGEVTEQTPAERIRYVWNLGAPRTTALRALGLDPDEYCTTERRGYSIEIITT